MRKESQKTTSGVSYEAVTFDFWDTLVAEHAGGFRDKQITYWSEALADAGEPVTPERLQQAFRSSWRRYESSWQENRQYRNADATAFILEALGLQAALDEAGALEAALQVGRAPAVGGQHRRAVGRVGNAQDVVMAHGMRSSIRGWT